MTLSTIERTLLKEKLVYLLHKSQYIYKDNMSNPLTPEQLNELVERRDHIVEKIESLIHVIEQ